MGTIRRIGIHTIGAIPVSSMGSCPAGGGANPWWDPLGEGLCIWAAYQPKGAADLASSYVDLSGNGNNAGVGVAPTWDIVNGWKFDGLTQYLTTIFLPQNDQSQTILVQYTNLSNAALRNLFGMRGTTGGDTYFSCRAQGGGWRYYGNGAERAIAGVTPLAGNLGVSGNQGFLNGASDGLAIGIWTGAGDRVVFIGANNLGVPWDRCALYCQAFALYDCTLTAPQVLSVSNAMSLL